MTQSLRPTLLALLLPFAIACLLYWPATHFGFLWDDADYVVGQQALASWDQAWTSAWSAYLQGSRVYFRPLPILSLALDLVPNGGAAAAAHLTNVLLHATNSALVAVLGYRLGIHLARSPRSSPLVGAFAGVLYAGHPALIQTAAWISCRFDLLLTFFALCFLLADGLLANSPRQRIATLALLFLLAALCKETAVVLPLMLPFWRRLFAPVGTSLRATISLRESAALAAAGCVYLLIRGVALRDVDAVHLPWLEGGQQVLLVLKTLGGLVWLAVFPFPLLSPLHPLHLPLRPLDPEVVTGIAVLAGAARALRSSRPLAPLLLCALIALLPTLNLVRFNLTDYQQERFLTLPLVFACLAAAHIFSALFFNTKVATRLLAFLIAAAWLVLSALTLPRYLPVWRSNLDLWAYALSRDPASPTAQKFALITLIAAGRSPDAAMLGQQLDRQFPQLTAQVRQIYVRALLANAEAGEALRQLDLVAQSETTWDADRRVDLCAEGGWVLLAAGQPAASEAMLRVALQQQAPGDLAEARYRLGIALAVQGRAEEAEREIQTAMQAAPESAAAWREGMQKLIADATTLTQQAPTVAPLPAHPALERFCEGTAPPP